MPNPYLGLIWQNVNLLGANRHPVSGYNTIATSSSGVAGLFEGGPGLFTPLFGETILTSATPGCPWGIGTLIAAPAWNNDMVVTFTGARENQADCVVEVVLPSPLVATPVELSSCGYLTSLKMEWTRAGTDAGLGGAGPFVAFSNVQIFGFCDAAVATLKAKANRKRTRRGATIKYQVIITNTKKTEGAIFEPAGVTITLPAGVTATKTATRPRVVKSPMGSMPYPSAVVSDSTVIFADAPLAGGKRRIYTVWAEIGNGATSPLVFLSKLTNCLQAAANDVTVGIVGAGKMEHSDMHRLYN